MTLWYLPITTTHIFHFFQIRHPDEGLTALGRKRLILTIICFYC